MPEVHTRDRVTAKMAAQVHGLSAVDLAKFKDSFSSEPKNRLAQSFVTQHGILSGSRVTENVPTHTFNTKVTSKFPHANPVTNQRSTGRCWMFSLLNTIRLPFIEKYNLADFEFSQSYLYFWDKIERTNYFLHAYISTRSEEVESRLVSWLLQEPYNDGGQWDMLVNLVTKYGIVPKSAYPECNCTETSRAFNNLITHKVRTGVLVEQAALHSTHLLVLHLFHSWGQIHVVVVVYLWCMVHLSVPIIKEGSKVSCCTRHRLPCTPSIVVVKCCFLTEALVSILCPNLAILPHCMLFLSMLQLREFCLKIRKLSADGKNETELHAERERMVGEIYRVCCISLGTPPTSFDWEYTDKDGKAESVKGITPLRFYEELIRPLYNMEDKICLIHDPRPNHPFMRLYTVQYLGNVIEGFPVRYVNVPISAMKEGATKALKNKEASGMPTRMQACMYKQL